MTVLIYIAIVAVVQVLLHLIIGFLKIKYVHSIILLLFVTSWFYFHPGFYIDKFVELPDDYGCAMPAMGIALAMWVFGIPSTFLVWGVSKIVFGTRL